MGWTKKEILSGEEVAILRDIIRRHLYNVENPTAGRILEKLNEFQTRVVIKDTTEEPLDGK